MFTKLTALAALSVAAMTSAASAGPAAVDGTWRSEDGEGIVEIAACAADATAKCGRIVWIKSPADDKGKPVRDAKNPDAALQKRPICGIEVVSGMKPVAEGAFEGGMLYDPEEGKSYKGTMKLDGAALVVTGYVEAPILGKLSDSEKWTRVTDPFERCAVK